MLPDKSHSCRLFPALDPVVVLALDLFAFGLVLAHEAGRVREVGKDVLARAVSAGSPDEANLRLAHAGQLTALDCSTKH